MGSRHYENKARRAFWVVHLEAWRPGGLTWARYCRDHRLDVGTFMRWLVQISGAEEARKHTEYQAERQREERRKRQQRKARRRFSIGTDTRSRAVQAFWAMHVEAMTWSGMGVREYAAALQLSPTSLRKWRDRLHDGEMTGARIFIRPPARPLMPERALTAADEAPPQPSRRYSSDTDKCHRGRDGAAGRQRLGSRAAAWDRHRAPLPLARAVRCDAQAACTIGALMQTEGVPTLPVLQELIQPPDGMTGVDLPDGRPVFAPTGADPEACGGRRLRGDGPMMIVPAGVKVPRVRLH